MTPADPREPFIETERRKMLEAKTIKEIQGHLKKIGIPIWIIIRNDGTIINWSVNKGNATATMNRHKALGEDCRLEVANPPEWNP